MILSPAPIYTVMVKNRSLLPAGAFASKVYGAVNLTLNAVLSSDVLLCEYHGPRMAVLESTPYTLVFNIPRYRPLAQQ